MTASYWYPVSLCCKGPGSIGVGSSRVWDPNVQGYSCSLLDFFSVQPAVLSTTSRGVRPSRSTLQ